MTNIEKFQKVWDAKDLEGVLGMLTDDVEMRMLHMDQTLKGPEAHAFIKELLLDDSVYLLTSESFMKMMNVL